MGMSIDECFKWLEYHKQGEVGKAVECIDLAIDTMRKYQNIEQILDDCDLEAWEVLENIKEVIVDGNDD